MVEDTEAELARLKRSKVANMIKMYQGAAAFHYRTRNKEDCHSPHVLQSIIRA